MSAEIRVAQVEDARRFLEIYAPVVRETAISFEEVAPRRPQSRVPSPRSALSWTSPAPSDRPLACRGRSAPV